MMSHIALRWQGFTFVGLALITVLAALLLAPIDSATALLLASLMIIFLGVPHGALDPLFVPTHPKMETFSGWVIFLSAYLLLSVAVVGLWWVSPGLFLLGFLGVSVFHFSGDLTGKATFAERFFYGGSVVVLPALLHHAELVRIFSMLAGRDESLLIVNALRLVAGPWLFCQVGLAFLCFKRDKLRALEIGAVAVLMLTAAPLLGFTVYFCAMHSARHILRTQLYTRATPQKMLLMAAGPMLAVLGFGLAVWSFRPEVAFEERLLQIIFVGLAALTVPHMVLIERIRLAGWQAKNSL